MAKAFNAISPASIAVTRAFRGAGRRRDIEANMGARVLAKRRATCKRKPMETLASATGVRLIGLPTDSHSSFLRGPAAAPPAIRAALFSDHGNAAAESGLELGSDIRLDDAGDLPLAEQPGDFDCIRGAAGQPRGDGLVPLFLGGDHMVTFPIAAGLAAVHGALNILHFDAHPDLYDDFGGDPLSHASPFARIMERGLAVRLVQVGIRTLNRHCREQGERFGVEMIAMRDFAVASVDDPRRARYISMTSRA